MRIPIAKDSFKFIVPLLVAGVVCFPLGLPYVGIVLLMAMAFVVYFFRDPERTHPNIKGCILSAADGKVTSIQRVDHEQFPGNKAVRISTFLSIFNVHINRSPISGNVKHIQYTPGKFFNAMNEKSSVENEHNEIHFSNDRVFVVVMQIAGMIARRVVCNCKIGEVVEKGQRFGLIRFGSRVDVFLPITTDIRVKVGAKVQGGKTILGITPEADE